jgi:hypothetical protein
VRKQTRDLATLVYHLGFAVMAIGLVTASETVMAGATIVVGASYAVRDYFDDRPGSVTVMTVYAFFGVFFFGLGNFLGFFAEAGPYEAIFNKYNVPEFHFEAQALATLGLVVPLASYRWIRAKFVQYGDRIPKVGFDMSDRGVLWFTLTVLALAWTANFGQIDVSGLGTLSNLIGYGSLVAIFTLQSRWLSGEHSLPTWTKWLPAIVMLVDATYNMMFRSLRVTVLWPIVAFCLPFMLRKLVTVSRVMVVVALVGVFMIAFKPLGELRGKIYGTERLLMIAQQSPFAETPDTTDDGDVDPWGAMTVAARVSTYNQLSQVVRIVEDDGLYGGETLAYVTYVFIPRIIWPNKPLITPGQWFASKLGKGQFVTETKFSNAINMTIPGELYLNFGWLGSIVGLLLLGALYLLFWEAAGFHRADQNPLGQGFACILLMQAAFNGSDIAAVVNMVLWYIVYLAVTWALATLLARRRRTSASGRYPPSLPPRLDGPQSLPAEPAPKLVGPAGGE